MKMAFASFLGVFMAFGFFGAAALAEPQMGGISGTVIDASGHPIAGARIAVRGTSATFAAISDANGRFAVSSMPVGAYDINVTAAKFEDIRDRVVNVAANQSTDISITMAPVDTGELATLGKVRVNGSRALSTSSAPSVDLDPQDLAGQGVEQLAEMLSEQIAVNLTRQMGGAPGLPSSVSIRGPDPSETLIDVDGHQVNNSNTGDFDISEMDPSQFSSVQIVYGIGPSSLVGANTEGGAVNFRTLEPTTTDQTLIRLSAGSYGTFAETAQTTGTDEQLGYALSWHHYTSQGEVHDYPIIVDNSGTQALVGSGINSFSYLAKLRYSPAHGVGFGEVTYRNLTSSRDLSAALSVPDNPNNAGPGAPFTQVNAPGAGALTVSPSIGFDVQLPLGGVQGGTSPATLIARHLTDTFSESAPNIDPALNPYLIDQHDTITDDSIEVDRYAQNATFTALADVRAERLKAPAVLAPFTEQAQTQRSMVLRSVWDTTPHLHYTAAAYFSRFDSFGSNVDPRVALVWTPNDAAVFRISVGTGFRSPLLAERVFNPNLKPERTTELESGYDVRLGQRGTTAGINLFRTNLRDPIFFTVDSSGALTFLKNLGRVVYQGAEVRLETPLNERTVGRVSYGINIAYPIDNPFAFDPAAPNVVAGEQFQGIAPHKLLFGVVHRSEAFDVGVDAAYESTNNELNRPAYWLLDGHVAKTFGRTQIALGLQNLTNQFDDKFTLPGAGTPYPTPTGLAPTDAFSLQGRAVTLTLTQHL